MKVLVRTACGCERIMDIERASHDLCIPLKTRFGIGLPSRILNPDVTFRRFELIRRVPPECGFEAIYEEVHP